MKNTDFTINIAHLYPDLMNIYGDFGNICALYNRLKWRNINVNVDKITKGDKIDFKKYDIYFIGGGQDKQQYAVSKELVKNKNAFLDLKENNNIMLGICGGYQLMGKYYQPFEQERVEGLGILDVYTKAGNKRCIGNVTVETNFLSPKTLVGFENHSGITILEKDVFPLGKVKVGFGNDTENKEEGAYSKNIFGTYLHGSLLPKNPHFCDYLLNLAIRQKINDNNFVLPELDDTIEFLAHNRVVNKKY